MQITSEVVQSKRIDHGHISVGVAAAQLLAIGYDFKFGIVLYASSGNAANIWIGKEGVTADANAITGGFPLVPGSSLRLPIAELLNVYGISTSASQDLAWIGV